MSAQRGHWRRRLLTGTNAVFVTVLVIAIVGILVDIAGRNRVRIDVSQDALATLMPETMAVLDTIDRQEHLVTITAFSSQRKGEESWYKDRTLRDLLRELEYESDNVQTRFVDFDQDRLTAERLGVTRYGTVVVEGRGDRIDLIDRDLFRRAGKEKTWVFTGESIIARALTQVLADEPRAVYFLEGHGERRIETTGPRGVAGLVTLLENQGWTIESLDLLRDSEGKPPQVPEDASAVVLPGLSAQLSPPEDQAIRDYLARGGRLGVFVDPGAQLPGFIEELGVRTNPGVVYDTVAVFPHEDRPVLRYGKHLITEELAEGNTTTMVAHAAPLELSSLEGVRAEPLIRTSRRGWTERGTERPAVYDANVDGPGPVEVAVALSVAAPHPMVNRGRVSRVVVMGDSDVLSDELIGEGPGNATFAVNTMRWLVGEDERMSMVGRPNPVRRLALSTAQLRLIQWIVLALLPLLAVGAGGIVWWIRRGR